MFPFTNRDRQTILSSPQSQRTKQVETDRPVLRVAGPASAITSNRLNRCPIKFRLFICSPALRGRDRRRSFQLGIGPAARQDSLHRSTFSAIALGQLLTRIAVPNARLRRCTIKVRRVHFRRYVRERLLSGSVLARSVDMRSFRYRPTNVVALEVVYAGWKYAAALAFKLFPGPLQRKGVVILSIVRR